MATSMRSESRTGLQLPEDVGGCPRATLGIRVVAHRAGVLSLDLCGLPRDVRDGCALGVVALLGSVTRGDSDLADALLVRLTSQILAACRLTVGKLRQARGAGGLRFEQG
eukprot:CAMPEP_0206501324 /NCGR_PEP_ID=MMETSP0324_2-20121206/53236_1 /ASSEMBLY_ACC=CAM_ASM_000836 /TAXON_ID=2866 /ORGANISM="Crypthecodinium cohnii, Strain Seligo" /LENGTH=109 /DNA_ID=CAMNT_0053989109 /DNA_START=290 /DNA_END=619 /DNA_ORIENTATION=-